MALPHVRRKVLELRKLGKSYGQIRKELGVSKSTLSDWLRNYPLTEEQLQNIRNNNEEFRVEKYRQTMLNKKNKKLLKYYNEAKNLLLPLSKRELLIAGVFLYWGEGTKTTTSQLTVSNTDPSLVKFALLWMTKALEIPKEKIQILVHLYKDMSISDSLLYWSELLNIPLNQFSKPYIKDSLRSSIDYRGFGHGTCNLRVYNTELKQRVLMAIKVVADTYRESNL